MLVDVPDPVWKMSRGNCCVPFAFGHLESSKVYCVRDLRIKQAESGIYFCRNCLDQPKRPDKGTGKADAAYRKIVDSPLSLGPVERICRYLHLSQGIFFNAVVGHKFSREAVKNQSTVDSTTVNFSNYTHSFSGLHDLF